MTRKTVSTLLAAGLLTMTLTTLAPKPAQAGADGRRNTTIALGAAAVYELLQHQTTNALILGVGTAYAEKQYENARSSERNQNNNHRYYRPGGYDDQNGRYQSGNGDYERRTDGSQDGWNHQDNDNRGQYGRPYGDNGQDGNGYGNAPCDPRSPHRGWDGRALPSGQNNGWKGDPH